MKTPLALYLLFLTVIKISLAENISTEEPSTKRSFSFIDPSKHIYKQPFGITQKDFIQSEGEPNGHLKFGDDKIMVIYGRNHGYIFADGKLSGLHISHHLMHWEIANQVPYSKKYFDRGMNWMLSNGICAGMSAKDAAKILGVIIGEDKTTISFKLHGCTIDLRFFKMSDGAKIIRGLTVLKNSG